MTSFRVDMFSYKPNEGIHSMYMDCSNKDLLWRIHRKTFPYEDLVIPIPIWKKYQKSDIAEKVTTVILDRYVIDIVKIKNEINRYHKITVALHWWKHLNRAISIPDVICSLYPSEEKIETAFLKFRDTVHDLDKAWSEDTKLDDAGEQLSFTGMHMRNRHKQACIAIYRCQQLFVKWTNDVTNDPSIHSQLIALQDDIFHFRNRNLFEVFCQTLEMTHPLPEKSNLISHSWNKEAEEKEETSSWTSSLTSRRFVQSTLL